MRSGLLGVYARPPTINILVRQVTALVPQARQAHLGDGLLSETTMGPLINRPQFE